MTMKAIEIDGEEAGAVKAMLEKMQGGLKKDTKKEPVRLATITPEQRQRWEAVHKQCMAHRDAAIEAVSKAQILTKRFLMDMEDTYNLHKYPGFHIHMDGLFLGLNEETNHKEKDPLMED